VPGACRGGTRENNGDQESEGKILTTFIYMLKRDVFKRSTPPYPLILEGVTFGLLCVNAFGIHT